MDEASVYGLFPSFEETGESDDGRVGGKLGKWMIFTFSPYVLYED